MEAENPLVGGHQVDHYFPAFPAADRCIRAHVVLEPQRLELSFKRMKFLLRNHACDQIDIICHADWLRPHIGDEQAGRAAANKHQ